MIWLCLQGKYKLGLAYSQGDTYRKLHTPIQDNGASHPHYCAGDYFTIVFRRYPSHSLIIPIRALQQNFSSPNLGHPPSRPRFPYILFVTGVPVVLVIKISSYVVAEPICSQFQAACKMFLFEGY